MASLTKKPDEHQDWLMLPSPLKPAAGCTPRVRDPRCNGGLRQPSRGVQCVSKSKRSGREFQFLLGDPTDYKTNKLHHLTYCKQRPTVDCKLDEATLASLAQRTEAPMTGSLRLGLALISN